MRWRRGADAARGRSGVASIVMAIALLAAGCAAPPPATMPATASATPAAVPDLAVAAMPDVWAELRAGTGLVVLLRHAQTTPGTGDPPEFRLDDCATQRNLSDEGRAQAARIGQAFRERGVPVARVLTSQWCRCVDTAELLDLGPVEVAPMLNSFFEDRATEPEQTRQVRRAIAAHRGRPGVIVMVTHMVNISAAAGVSVPQGGALVVRAGAGDEIEVVGQLSEW